MSELSCPPLKLISLQKASAPQVIRFIAGVAYARMSDPGITPEELCNKIHAIADEVEQGGGPLLYVAKTEEESNA